MSRSDIEAGRAHVRLTLNDSALIKGLHNAQMRLRSFGQTTMVIGGMITAAGAAILGPLVSAAKQFSSVGDSFEKMAARTGVGVEALSALSHAADLSGTSIDSVEKGIARMQRTIGEAAQGTGTAVDALENLGLSMQDLQGLSPDKQFEAMADKISQIEDPTMRAAAAMEIFGRSGTELLPLFAGGADGIRKMMEEARELGLVLTQEDAKAAAGLNDALGRVTAVLKAIPLHIGAALAKTLTEAANAAARLVSKTIAWIKENRELVTSIAAIGAGLLAAGTAITAFGGFAFFASQAIGAVIGTLALAKAAFVVLLSPIGLVTVGLAAGVTAWMKYTESGKQAMAAITSALGGLLDIAKATFGGIADALVAGDLKLAGQIAMAGLKVAWTQGLAEVMERWNDFRFKMIEAFEGAVLSIKGLWLDLGQFMINTITKSAQQAVAAFNMVAFAAGQPQLQIQGFFEKSEGMRNAANFGIDKEREKLGEDSILATLREDLERSSQTYRDAVAAAEATFQGLLQKAKVEREAAVAAMLPKKLPDAPTITGGTFGSFSSRALNAAGGSDSQQRLERLAERQAAKQEETNRLLQEVIFAVKESGLIAWA